MTRRRMRRCDRHHEEPDWVRSVNRIQAAPIAVSPTLGVGVGGGGAGALIGSPFNIHFKN
jgi:hypothetical protein